MAAANPNTRRAWDDFYFFQPGERMYDRLLVWVRTMLQAELANGRLQISKSGVMWSLISSLWDRLELSSFAQYQKDHLKYTARNNLLKWFDSNKMSSSSTPRISPVRWERAPRNAVTVFFRYVRTTWRFDLMTKFLHFVRSQWVARPYLLHLRKNNQYFEIF